MIRPRPGGLGAFARSAIAGLAGIVLISCASGPAGAGKGSAANSPGSPGGSQTRGSSAAASSGAPSSPVAGSTGGTAIQTATVAAPSKAQSERKAISEAIAFGSPTSLTRAFELIRNVTGLDRSEAILLAWVGARVATIVYPLRSPSFVPQDLQSPGDIPSGAIARMVSEALSGRVPALPPENAGDPLAEILPALSVFRSDSHDTARLALAALDRFEHLGAKSVLPAMIRGLDAERRKAWTESLAFYLVSVDAASDAWPSVIGATKDYLALGKPAEALELISRTPEDIQNDSDFNKIRAEALYENGVFDKADPLVAGALRNDPLDSKLILMRAHLLVRAKQYQQALPLLDAFATVDLNDRTYVLLRALSSEGLRNRDEALRWSRKGMEAFPGDPEFLTLTARVLFGQQGLSAEAKAAALSEGRELARSAFDLTAAGATVPELLSPLRLGGWKGAGGEAARLLLEESALRFDWISASRYVERAHDAPGFSNEALVCLVLRRSGEWGRALDHASEWYRLNPSSEAAADAYLRGLIGSGNTKAAEDLLPRLLLQPGTTAGRSSLHYTQSLLSKTEESALASLRTALVENADNVDALLAMYDIWFRRQDWQKSRFYLKQALALAPADPEIIRRSRDLAEVAP